MTSRVIAFTLIWAYVAGALWLLNATPDLFPFLWLFPPGYFFVVGLFFGVLSELPASRWPRLWVTVAVGAASLELGIFLYGGHSIGLSLGYIFVLAVLCASLAVKALAPRKPLLVIGTILGCLLVFSWIASSRMHGANLIQLAPSPDGAFQALIVKEQDGDYRSFHIGPRYGWNGAFGRKVVESGYLDENDGYQKVEVQSFSWKENHTINLKGLFPKDLPPSSALLPIPILPIKTTQTP